MDDVRLRDVVEADLPIFFEHQWDPEATRMAAFPARNREAFLAHWRTKILGGAGVAKTILSNGQVAGNIVCWQQAGRPLVGYWIGRDFWGQGIATRALALFLDLVRARPLYAHVAKHNRASIRVLEKCGFRTSVPDGEPTDPPEEGIEEVVMELGPEPE